MYAESLECCENRVMILAVVMIVSMLMIVQYNMDACYDRGVYHVFPEASSFGELKTCPSEPKNRFGQKKRKLLYTG